MYSQIIHTRGKSNQLMSAINHFFLLLWKQNSDMAFCTQKIKSLSRRNKANRPRNLEAKPHFKPIEKNESAMNCINKERKNKMCYANNTISTGPLNVKKNGMENDIR